MTSPASLPAVDLRNGAHRVFLHLLVNVLLVSVINFTVWFAITFWVYLETESVLATGMVAGIFLVATALSGIWFGSLVDRMRKKTVMQGSTLVSLVIYLAAFALYLATPKEVFTDPASVRLWIFIVVAMLGVIAGNVRTIALMTLVTVLVEAERRDKANGLVGTASGVSFLITSVISGLLVAAGDMFYVLLLAMGVMVAALIHLARVQVDDRRRVAGEVVEAAPADPGDGKVDLRGTLRLVRSVPGLLALIGFSCFNNFLGGAFMALIDAYGLSLMSVQAWGLLWGALSAGFIVGGLAVAKTGLSSNPLRVLLLVNVVLWSATILFPLRSSIVFLTIGMAIYMLLIPYAEAAEQTILQKVVPYERQGRVFGFAQSVEQAASPLTAFLIGPITQLAFIPFMTDGGRHGPDRRLVRHRPGPRDRAGLRADRGDRAGRHRAGAAQPVLPAVEHPVRRGGSARHQRSTGRDRGHFLVGPGVTCAEVVEAGPLAARPLDRAHRSWRAAGRSATRDAPDRANCDTNRPELSDPVRFRAEDSPRGLWRSLGKRVGFTPSRVRISYPPPL